MRGNNSVPQASTILTDYYALPPPVSHGSWTTLIPEQRFKMPAEVVISLGEVKWFESVVSFLVLLTRAPAVDSHQCNGLS